MIFEGDPVRLKDTKAVPVTLHGKPGQVGKIDEETHKLYVISGWQLLVLDRKDVQEIIH
jgi:hypothetical protein